MLTPADLAQRIETDGALAAGEISPEFAGLLRRQVWGHGFPEPRFSGRFAVQSQRVVGEKHTKLMLSIDGRRFSAIRFGSAQSLPPAIDAVYRLELNEYQGASTLQLVIEHVSE
jgi:single-stranded-DNA-specific exonuclease